jgi:hypothetical protein
MTIAEEFATRNFSEIPLESRSIDDPANIELQVFTVNGKQGSSLIL